METNISFAIIGFLGMAWFLEYRAMCRWRQLARDAIDTMTELSLRNSERAVALEKLAEAVQKFAERNKPATVQESATNPYLSPDGLRLEEAGVDPTHQTDHCDHCQVQVHGDGVSTCDDLGPLTLCEACYQKAGNSVR